ncbi:MAG: hypothetical protein IKI50_00465 [Clostridia bacterium]|nr:hypothetical protein [Clostridia bacterium]
MNFVLDLLGALLIIFLVLLYWKRSVPDALLTVTASILALTAAVFLCRPVTDHLTRPLLQPAIEQSAANELADLFSAPHLSTGADTVAALDLSQTVISDAPAYRTLLARYAADRETVLRAYQTEGTPYAVLHAVASPWTELLAHAAAFSLCWLVLNVLLRLIARRIARNLPPSSPVRGAMHLPAALLGLISAYILLCGLQLLLAWLIPAGAGRIIFLENSSAGRSVLHLFFKQCNVFWWLLFG